MVNVVARPKISVYLDDEVYQWLEQRAKKEIRSPANLAEYLITQIYKNEINQKEKN